MKSKPKQNVRQKIIATAETLFSQQGFDATGIDQIAKTAGITKSLIYYYFKSKDDLLSAIFQDFIAELLELQERVRTILASAPHAPHMRTILKDYTLPFLMEHKEVIKIAFAESLKETTVTPHLNIFRYFDQSRRTDLGLMEELAHRFDRRLYNLGGFFFSWVPLFAFVVFSDEWCENYRCDLAAAIDYFVDAYVLIYDALKQLPDSQK